MSLFDRLRSLIEEPPPAFVFELGPSGIAYWHANVGVRFEAGLGYGEAGEGRDVDPGALTAVLNRIAPQTNGNWKRPAAVILPDRCARVSLLDFDSFPRKAEDQMNLIRLRLKRTLPFDVDSAVLRYSLRPLPPNRIEVTVAAISVETLAPFEAAFRNAGFHPGFITLSGLSSANLAEPNSLTLRLGGLMLTVTYFEGVEMRLYRCLELQEGSLEQVLNVLDPTLAYLEDERQKKPSRADICGFGGITVGLAEHLWDTWRVAANEMESKHGKVHSYDAGLHGYLEAAGVK